MSLKPPKHLHQIDKLIGDMPNSKTPLVREKIKSRIGHDTYHRVLRNPAYFERYRKIILAFAEEMQIPIEDLFIPVKSKNNRLVKSGR